MGDRHSIVSCGSIAFASHTAIPSQSGSIAICGTIISYTEKNVKSRTAGNFHRFFGTHAATRNGSRRKILSFWSRYLRHFEKQSIAKVPFFLIFSRRSLKNLLPFLAGNIGTNRQTIWFFARRASEKAEKTAFLIVHLQQKTSRFFYELINCTNPERFFLKFPEAPVLSLIY